MAFQPHRPYGQTTRVEPIYPGIPFSDHKPLPLMSLGNPRLRMTSQPLSGQFPADRGIFNQEGVHPVGGPRTFLQTRVPRPRAFQPRVHGPSTSHIRPEMAFTKYLKNEDKKVDIHTFHDTSKMLEKSHEFVVKAETNDSNKESAENINITMDSYDRDLHFDVDSSGLTAWTLHKDGFEYLWGGARASHGIRSGKVAFECAIIEALPVAVPPTERNPHVARVGWSIDSSDFQLGEDKLSYGYGGTGKVSLDSKFSDYGRPFSVGDVVTCLLDLDSCPKTMSFMVNGENFGVAFRIGPELGDRVLYPHVTSKNMKFTMNFGGQWPRYPLSHGFCLLQNVLPKNLIKAPSGPTRKDAEFIMMVGLPACGKTVWANKFCKDHPEKKYYMLGTNNIIEKMRIMGLSRKGNYHGRWDALIKQATGCLNVWLKIAEKRIANYILDQTNVYFSARRRKMRNFTGYKRIACVIVNNRQVLEERTTKREREEGKLVPAEAVMEMKANLSLPEVGESFDEVRYIEEKPPIARAIVNSFKAEGEAFKRGAKRISNQDSHANAKVPRTDFQNDFQKNTRSNENGPNQRGKSSVEPSWEDSNGIRSYNQGIRDEYYQRDGIRNHNDRFGARPSYPTNDQRQPFGSREGERKSYEERYEPINQFAERGFLKPSYFDRYTRQQPYEVRNERPPYADMGTARHNFANRDITTQPYVATDTTRLSHGGRDIASVGNIPEENFDYRHFHTVVKEEPRPYLTERRYESSALLSSSEASRFKEYANASYGAGNCHHSTETIYQGSTQSYSPVGERTKDDQFRRQDRQDSYIKYNQANYQDQRRGGKAVRDCHLAGANHTIDPRQIFGTTPPQAEQHYRHRIKEEPKDDWPDHYSQGYSFSQFKEN